MRAFDVGISGAARVHEKADVERLSLCIGADGQTLRQPTRHQSRLKPVLEREAHSQIGGQTGGCDHLCGAHPLRVRDRRFSHKVKPREGE